MEPTKERAQPCRAKGHTVFEHDVFRFLRPQRKRFDNILARHVIEHGDIRAGLRLLQFAYDALRENGVLVIVTPTFRDILVRGERFRFDISHVRPYPLPLHHKLFTHLGLEIVDERHEASRQVWRQFGRLHTDTLTKPWFGRNYEMGHTFIV